MLILRTNLNLLLNILKNKILPEVEAKKEVTDMEIIPIVETTARL